MVFCFFIIISNNFMEEKCICSVQIWKEVFDYFDRESKKIEINENYSIDEDAKETLQEKNKRMLVDRFTARNGGMQTAKLLY